MTVLCLSFPRLRIGLTVPDALWGDAREVFRHFIRPAASAPPHHYFAIRTNENGFDLLKDGHVAGRFDTGVETLCRVEEEIENTLIRAVDDWIAFHAGAVRVEGRACLIAGHPDTGKTTTTLQLIEMGHPFLCEEVAPVDPGSRLVHPYPQGLTLCRDYAEAYRSMYPVQNGVLKMLDEKMARFQPFDVAPEPAPLKTILIPCYDPQHTPGIEQLDPADVLTELLGYCFPPNRDDEHLFDWVISICEKTEIFRIRSSSIQSTQDLLKELIGPDPEP